MNKYLTVVSMFKPNLKFLLFVFVCMLIGCKPTNQLLEFNGFKIDKGVYIADPGWKFVLQDDDTYALAKRDDDNSNSGGRIEPCDCALETGGSCDQVPLEDDYGNIIEIWCISNGCGFCVGGVSGNGQVDVNKTIKIKLDKNVNRKILRN